MSKVFRITPKRFKRANGTVLTPDMVITVTTRQHTTDPFYNGAVEIQEQYMRMFQFDYARAHCSKYDFDFVKLDKSNWIMEDKQKWTIADDVLKKSFRALGLDVLYFPLFRKNVIERLNDVAETYEPEQDDIDLCIANAADWVKICVEQIKLGLSKQWACSYADNRVSWSKDESANEAYNNVCKDLGEKEADKDLAIFTKSLCDDPVFVESYIDIFHDCFMDAENRAHEYTNLYKSLMDKGKSDVYARQYARHHINTPDDEYCHLYASKYEECINKGIDSSKAEAIAEEYENYYGNNYPQDYDLAGKEFIDVYIKGFEYAIVNGIDSPEEFANEYQRAYYNNGKRPSYVAKGKYDDIISQLLAEKV